MEQGRAVAAFALGFVHRDVRAAQQFVTIEAMRGVHGDADARPCPMLRGRDDEGNMQRFQDLVGGTRGLAGVRCREDDHEFVAAVARDQGLPRQVLPQPPRRGLQQPVADGVPVAVVDVLEMVQVDEQDGELVVGRQQGRERPLQAEGVAQAREQVVGRPMFQLIFAGARHDGDREPVAQRPGLGEMPVGPVARDHDQRAVAAVVSHAEHLA